MGAGVAGHGALMGIGIALGGVAEGLESAEKLRQGRDELKQRMTAIAQDSELRNRALDIQSKQEDRLANQDLLSQADTIIGKQLSVVGEVVKAAKSSGHTPQEISAAIEPILADVDRLSSRVGRDSSSYRKQVAAMLALPDSETQPFAGTGMEASSANILTQLTGKADKGLPLTTADKRAYAIAYQELTSPRVVGSPTTGFSIIQPTLDPSVFPSPESIGKAPAGGSRATPQAPQAPQVGQEVSPFGTELDQTARGATITPLSGPKPTADQAGRSALVTQGARGAQRVREAIVNTDGSINRDTVFSMSSDIPLLGKGVPGTKGRGVRSVLEDSLASKLRLETGAQANETELQNIVDRFMPSLLDDDSTIRDKMERLNQFFTDALHKTDPELARTLIDRAAEAGNIPAPPQSEPDAEFQGFDASSGVAVFKRTNGTFFGIPQKQKKG